MEDKPENGSPAYAPSVWSELKSWVARNGGQVNPSLILREADLRGVFASQAIGEGEVLIYIPLSLSINGQSLPNYYMLDEQKRQASPWLRCLSAYLQQAQASAKDHANKSPYLTSFPQSYETLWRWSEAEVDQFLAGTSPPSTTVASSESWKLDLTALQQRYMQQIRPYLVHCRIAKDSQPDAYDLEHIEFQQFATACQVLSTRGFHMEAYKDGNKDSKKPSFADPSYSGPFLLPVMDMLNHASKSMGQTCTTLQRQTTAVAGDSFVMVAERNIAVGEEIFHSYGDLSSSQFLASFGFVPNDKIDLAAQKTTGSAVPTTPVILSKMAIFESCWEVIESELPEKLTASMKEQDMEDEVWSLQVERYRKADYVPEEILVSVASSSVAIDDASSSGVQDLDLLTEELVTACCVPLLPRCAYSEITERTLLDRNILEDYFLGKLVGAVMLKAIEQKLASYTPISEDVVRRLLGNGIKTEKLDDDCLLLQALRSAENADNNSEELELQRQRLSYALTVRIEEKNTLVALRRQVVALLSIIDVDVKSTSKRHKAIK